MSPSSAYSMEIYKLMGYWFCCDLSALLFKYMELPAFKLLFLLLSRLSSSDI